MNSRVIGSYTSDRWKTARPVQRISPGVRTGARCLVVACLLVLAAEGWLPRASGLQGDGGPSFGRAIRPVLSRCLACHGPDEEARQADLRLDLFDAATADRGGYRAIEPGGAAKSELLARVTSGDPDVVMPPPSHGPPLSEAETRLLREWIDAGAKYDEHWAWRAPPRPGVPADPAGWANGAVDSFVAERMIAAGLQPNPPAGRAALLRRLALDLTGLPPTLEQLDAFLADSAPDAIGQQIDRYLADPAFGERWAAVWLDLARYADSQGYSSDELRTIWAWRDYVIRSLNDNKPFDRFTIEQIAGDLLPDATDETRIATAFHRNTLTNTEGGTDDEEFRSVAVVDRVNTTMAVWMGTTMACAQCHTHKYDPITQAEYFGLYAIFNQTTDTDRADDSPRLMVFEPETQARREELASELGTLDLRIEANQKRQLELGAELERLGPTVNVPVMEELPDADQRETHVHLRGNHLTPGERVEPGTPAVFHSLPAGVKADRLALAQWLVSRDNPLTARVMVNRVWEQLFGAGLVTTVEDFGSQGTPPSHPKLLDWLAVEFMESGWDLKHLIRIIVSSATWQQSSKAEPAKLAADPENRWLARGPRVRLTAEMVRDQALAVSGLLDRKLYGPPVHPPKPDLGLRLAFSDKTTDWTASEGGDRYRRAIYTELRRSMPYPAMATFDCPNREVTELRRIATNTPLQALVTLNDPVFVEAAQALAREMMTEAGTVERDAILRHGWRLGFAREPSTDEVAVTTGLFEQSLSRFNQDLPSAMELAGLAAKEVAEEELPRAAAWVVVANAILNLDETFQKR